MNTEQFKIHCIALTKNEGDVIEDCLLDASGWADYIYVYDGASSDDTWEIVKRMESEKVIPWKQDGKVFSEGLRAEVFNEFRKNSNKGDWWIQLNVDEYYPESPREFFRRVPAGHDFVWGITVEYYLTEKELESIDFTQQFCSIRPQLRHYRVGWSEPRAFRYRDRLEWRTDCAWPNHVGVIAKERIVFKHYPFRSPRQIQMRLDVRRDNRERGFEGWDHAKEEDWREKIVDHDVCYIDDGESPLKIDESRLPRHLERPHIRLLKKLLHGSHLWP